MDIDNGNPFIAKLTAMAERFEEIEKLLMDPVVASDHHRFTPLIREKGSIEKVVTLFRTYARHKKSEDEARGILADPDADEELREMAKTEVEEAAAETSRLFTELQEMLLSNQEGGSRNVIIEIRAGTGGEEASLFAGDLFRMYKKFADSVGWKTEILDSHPTTLGGFKDIIISIEGMGAYQRFRNESGGHRVQRVPETETQGRLHTSACTVAVLPEAQEVEVDIKTDDLRVEFFRASGPGGQKVNKTSSAVRITHLPTNTVVSCQDEKSQHKNRSRAMKVLRSRIYDKMQQEEHRKRSLERKGQIGSGDRSQRIRTYNFPQDRVSDHRLGRNFPLAEIVEGRLEAIFNALLEWEKEQRLKNLEI
jgi:peptide chain release factor 1